MKNRRDGKFVKNIGSMNALMPYILPKRRDSEVYINQKFDVTELIKYVEKKKKENLDVKLTYFHVFVTAISKVVYNRPLLNRFIVNKRYFDRKEVSISFVAKTAFKDESEELMSTVIIEKNDTLDTIKNKITQKVSKVRSNKNNSTDEVVSLVGKSPKMVRDIVMKIFMFLDRHDLLPESLCRDNIYYSTVLVSNLGSIDCETSIYHHLTDFGTNSIVITIGKIHKEVIVNEDGKEEIRDICDFGVTADERIADGFYFIKSMKEFEKIFRNPKMLEDAVKDAIGN